MTSDFDKQIDSLLRNAVKDSPAETPSLSEANAAALHLDADEIGAFAENALPQIARVRATKHLADCLRCRKILSDVVSLNSEFRAEENLISDSRAIVSTSVVPWYRKLFAAQNLAYTLGALALLFGGAIAIIVFQNATGSRNSEVAQVSEKTLARNDADSFRNANQSSNLAAANIAVPQDFAATNANAASVNPRREEDEATKAAASAPGGPRLAESKSELAKTAAPEFASPQETGKDARADTALQKENAGAASGAAINAPKLQASPAVAEKNRDEDKKIQLDGVQASTDVSAAGQNVQQVQNQTQNQTGVLMPDTQNSRRDMPAKKSVSGISSKQEPEVSAAGRSSVALEAKAKETAPARNLGGKTFNVINGIWTDSTYSGQKTKRVKRNSNDYKKLDANLRAIADDLGGTVIIVWTGKAYRIQ